MKRTIALLLSVLLIFGTLPAQAFAEENVAEETTIPESTIETTVATEPKETVPETTAAPTEPDETVAETTATPTEPEETVPETTVAATEPEETVPETTIAATEPEETVPETTVPPTESEEIVPESTVPQTEPEDPSDVPTEPTDDDATTPVEEVIMEEVVVSEPEMNAAESPDKNDLTYLIANLPTVSDPTGAKYYFYDQLVNIEKAMYWKMTEATWNTPSITISGVGAYTSDELYAHAFRALTALQADSPEYHMYWNRGLESDFNPSEGIYTWTLYKLEGSTDYLIQKAKARVQEIVSVVGTEGDLYSRARDLLEYVFQEMDYSHYYPFRTNTSAFYDHNAIGALVYNNATCEGFSDSVKMLCDALNIPCIVVGNAGHAWNFIQMDDGLWYSADASADCSFYYVSKRNLIGKIEMQGNSNYTISDLYLWSAGAFSFPDVPDDDYVYAGNYQETYHDAVNSFIEPDPKFIYSINSDGVSCTITDYEGVQSGDLIVPASIDGYTVTAIGESAFHGCTGFTGDLIIPDTVTIIGDGAFQECTQLSGQFNLPEKLESIGSCAFVGNEKMKGSLNFSDGLSNIGRAAFYKCSSLTGDIRLPNGVTLGDDIFTYCEGLDGTIYLPDDMVWSGNILTGTGITAIEVSENNENYATADGLLYTKDMKRLLAGPGGKTGDLIIPEGVEIISRAAFYKYTNLNGTLKLPESLRIIEEFAIYGTHLTGDVIIPDSVESIGAHAFVGGYFNGQLKLPKNLKRIEEGTFSGQDFSGTLNIPATVEYIGSAAFYGNQELESIIFSGDAPVIESDSFGFLEATCYYPAGNSTWDSVILNKYGANEKFSWVSYRLGEHFYDNNVDGTCNICGANRETIETRHVTHMLRMYNPYTGEHFYTGSEVEKDNLVAAGWNYEGVGFTFPANTGAPVYRLYDPVTGEHLYTMDEEEKATLEAVGWNYEGIAFNSAYDTEAVQHRLHNPYATVGAYHFTFSEEEKNNLIAAGWEYQGIGWYSCYS